MKNFEKLPRNGHGVHESPLLARLSFGIVVLAVVFVGAGI